MVLITEYNDIVNNALDLEIIKKTTTLNRIVETVKQYINNAII